MPVTDETDTSGIGLELALIPFYKASLYLSPQSKLEVFFVRSNFLSVSLSITVTFIVLLNEMFGATNYGITDRLIL